MHHSFLTRHSLHNFMIGMATLWVIWSLGKAALAEKQNLRDMGTAFAGIGAAGGGIVAGRAFTSWSRKGEK